MPHLTLARDITKKMKITLAEIGQLAIDAQEARDEFYVATKGVGYEQVRLNMQKSSVKLTTLIRQYKEQVLTPDEGGV